MESDDGSSQESAGAGAAGEEGRGAEADAAGTPAEPERPTKFETASAAGEQQGILLAGQRDLTKGPGKPKKDGNAVGTSDLLDGFTQEEEEAGLPFNRANNKKSSPAVSNAESSLTQEELAKYAEQIAGFNQGRTLFRVVGDVAELPFDAPQDAAGAFNPADGIIYLVAPSIRNTAHAREVILHETVGHFGLRGFFGKLLNSTLDSIYKHNVSVQQYAGMGIQQKQVLIRTQERNMKTFPDPFLAKTLPPSKETLALFAKQSRDAIRMTEDDRQAQEEIYQSFSEGYPSAALQPRPTIPPTGKLIVELVIKDSTTYWLDDSHPNLNIEDWVRKIAYRATSTSEFFHILRTIRYPSDAPGIISGAQVVNSAFALMNSQSQPYKKITVCPTEDGEQLAVSTEML